MSCRITFLMVLKPRTLAAAHSIHTARMSSLPFWQYIDILMPSPPLWVLTGASGTAILESALCIVRVGSSSIPTSRVKSHFPLNLHVDEHGIRRQRSSRKQLAKGWNGPEGPLAGCWIGPMYRRQRANRDAYSIPTTIFSPTDCPSGQTRDVSD